MGIGLGGRGIEVSCLFVRVFVSLWLKELSINTLI